jgi:putative heme-binding domain-containing protein
MPALRQTHRHPDKVVDRFNRDAPIWTLRCWFLPLPEWDPPAMLCTPLRILVVFTCLTCCLPSTSAQQADGQQWHSVPIPEAWRRVPQGELAPIDGYSWYRALVRIPAAWQGQPLKLHVEAIDDARSTWFNGRMVGAAGTFPPQFRSGLGEKSGYQVDPSDVRYGELNSFAIRVYQNDPRPNFSVAPPVLVNEAAMQGMRLEGNWQYRPGDNSDFAVGLAADFGLNGGIPEDAASAREQGVYLAVDDISNLEQYIARRAGDTAPLSPEAALAQFDVSEDLKIELVVSDPEIAQPLFMTWDGHGRLWVVEYRQYPDPAGLTMVSRDTYLRTVYDKVPPPPPNHVRGADRISIHTDTNGDGLPDEHKVFVDGLNLATSCAIGRGGVFVTNPPYLLFYPDQDGDDVPDGDPVVLLEGFGIEDSHSVINSLRFGPDGWLYGAQGSTVSAAVRKPGSKEPPILTLGQQIWRYHPEQERFEVFAEGGGNTFGCEIDAWGRVYSGHNGGDTRGFHYVQGGYYRKGFGKHGPLSNPYAFGFFEDMQHASVPRFTHNFVIYDDSVLPERFHGKLFGIEPLQGRVVASDVQPDKSSFRTEDIERPLTSKDPWFRPVDIKTGPDGYVYIADFYEQRIDHSSHYAGRIDRSSGRIYRLVPRDGGRETQHVPDYSSLPTGALIEALTHPVRWHRQTAQRVLGDRRDVAAVPQLKKLLSETVGQPALEYLWALHNSGGLTDAVALQLLQHPEPHVRAWTVRLVCDRRQVDPAAAAALAQLAADEPYIVVRKQLASSARRLPTAQALPILKHLIKYDEDAADIHQPLLLWWALEAHVQGTEMSALLQQLLPQQDSWDRPLVQQHLLERLMKRLAMSGTRAELLAAAELLSAAPNSDATNRLLQGFESAFRGRSMAVLPEQLVEAIAATGGGSLTLRILQNQPDAVEAGLQLMQDSKAELSQRSAVIEALGTLQTGQVNRGLQQLVASENDPKLLIPAIAALQRSSEPEVAEVVLGRLDDLPADVRSVAESMLSSRSEWSLAFLRAVGDGRLEQADVSEQALRRMLMHDDDRIRDLIHARWGQVTGATTAQMSREADRIRQILSSGSGNPKQGKVQYRQLCGRCHYLFDEGGQIGPDLTPFVRSDVERVLQNIINPSLEIREGFENHVLITTDGRVLTGFVADRDSQVVVIRGVDGNNVIVPSDDIEELRAIPQSVMPEGTLKTLTDQQIRDLFAYLRSSQPVNY